ncbi:hypothetical protein Bbelb_137920 [Branchiostoma belcheri]|nr:hypothetical protein Bbelb_137920 [Branchiostoma belcheri]
MSSNNCSKAKSAAGTKCSSLGNIANTKKAVVSMSRLEHESKSLSRPSHGGKIDYQPPDWQTTVEKMPSTLQVAKWGLPAGDSKTEPSESELTTLPPERANVTRPRKCDVRPATCSPALPEACCVVCGLTTWEKAISNPEPAQLSVPRKERGNKKTSSADDSICRG